MKIQNQYFNDRFKPLRLAVALALVAQAGLALAGRYRLSYDAYVHMFFADHYRQSWWSLWEPRWYAGFNVASYPPLVHQLIALLSRAVGVEAGFALLLALVTAALPVGIYAFARIFAGRRAAGYAALAAAFLPSVYLAAHTFGQLPTLAGLLAGLFGLAALAAYLRRGRGLDLGLGIAWMAAAAAAHHGTLLFLAPAAGAVALHLFLSGRGRLRTLGLRLGLFGLLAGGAMLLVVWPFWQWGLGQSIQTPIDHLSRHSYLADPSAFSFFFWPAYGPLAALIPWAGWLALRGGKNRRPRRKSLALAGLFFFFLVLGFGGTTPLPRLLFGQGWAWLTYDRFILWGTAALLPLAGQAALLARRRLRRVWARRALGLACLAVLAVTSLHSAFLASTLRTQPDPLDLQPIATFLLPGARWRWRYLTFGLGDQMARLSLLTRATTIDGSYHTARELPELRQSGLGQIDTAYWTQGGMLALNPILDRAGSYGVKWAFTNLPIYERVLRAHGWLDRGELSNGVRAWENPRAAFPPPERRSGPLSPLATFSWGTLPLAALGLALGLSLVRLAGLRRALLGAQRLATGLLPVALGLWYFHPVRLAERPRVYFTYDSILLYASDALALVIVGAWLAGWLIRPRPLLSQEPRLVTWGLVGLALLGSASVLWSADRPLSAYAAMHLWLLLGLYLALRDDPASWREAALGCLAVLALQAGLGGWGFLAQATGFLHPLGLNWPGSLTAASREASVVELVDGERWLRLYGTLPHPNLAAGLLLGSLAAPLAIFLRHGRRRWWAAALFGAGTAALGLTFSRSAWLGFAVGGCVLAWRMRGQEAGRLPALAAVAALSVASVAVPLGSLVSARVGGAPVQTEVNSTVGRVWMSQEALSVLRDHPLGGVGLGAYVDALAQRLPGTFKVEPVHNVALLAAGELGLAGGLLCLLVGAAVLAELLRRGSPASTPAAPEALALSAALAGLLVVAMLDHYLWSLPPGRTLMWMLLGLWAGQIKASPDL